MSLIDSPFAVEENQAENSLPQQPCADGLQEMLDLAGSSRSRTSHGVTYCDLMKVGTLEATELNLAQSLRAP